MGGFRQLPGLLNRIDEAVKVELWIARDLFKHVADGARAHQLVGEHQPLETMAASDLQLLHGADSDRPGPVIS